MKNDIIEQYAQICIAAEDNYDQLKANTAATGKLQRADIPSAGSISVFLHPMAGNYIEGNPLHSHDYFEMIYVYRGNAVQYLKSGTKQLAEGSLCVMNMNYKHGLSISDEYSLVFNILVTKEVLNTSFLNLLSGNDLFYNFFTNSLFFVSGSAEAIYLSRNEASSVETYTQALIEEYILQKPCYQSVMQSYLSLIFTQILRNHIYTIDRTLEQHTDLSKLMTYISAHLSDITLNSLAGHFHYTPSYLSKIFKQYTGKTFSSLVNEIRLQKAADYLKESSLSINEIVSVLGYYDRSYFNRSFRKYYGMNPGSYRKIYNGKR